MSLFNKEKLDTNPLFEGAVMDVFSPKPEKLVYNKWGSIIPKFQVLLALDEKQKDITHGVVVIAALFHECKRQHFVIERNPKMKQGSTTLPPADRYFSLQKRGNHIIFESRQDVLEFLKNYKSQVTIHKYFRSVTDVEN